MAITNIKRNKTTNFVYFFLFFSFLFLWIIEVNFKKYLILDIFMADVKILINDKEIPINQFIKDVVVNVNIGLVESLKKIPEQKKSIKIEIKL